MGEKRAGYESSGPFRADKLRPGDRYELHDGHAIYCAPAGGHGSRVHLLGAEVLGTDPDVEEAGIDAGYSQGPKHLRAPDVAVGNVPDAPGWIRGAPPLALEYAGSGQDEDELQEKIADLLESGTRFVWVVRLVSPRRVEVYEPGKTLRTFGPGTELLAPGVLKNPVLVESLYDRSAAHRATLRNLLQRQGYESIEAIRLEARLDGLFAVLAARGIAAPEAAAERMRACTDRDAIDAWVRRAATADKLSDVIDD